MSRSPPQNKAPCSTGVESDALHLQAYFEYVIGNYREAEAKLCAAVSAKNSDARYHFDLGLVRWELGEFETAVTAFARAATLEPRNADARYNAAIIAAQDRTPYVSHLTRAIRSHPLLVLRWIAAQFLHSLRRRPAQPLDRHGWQIPDLNLPEVQDVVALGFQKAGKLERSIAAAQRALAQAPTADRHAALGTKYFLNQQWEKALPHFEAATHLDPLLHEYAFLRGFALERSHRYDEAVALYKTCLNHESVALRAASRLLVLATVEGRLNEAEEYIKRVVHNLTRLKPGSMIGEWKFLATLAYRDVILPLPPPLHHRLIRDINTQLDDITRQRGGCLTAPGSSRPRRARLRVGYLSSFLRNHPVGHMTADLFSAHDRKRVEVHVFHAYGAADEYTKRVKTRVEHFHDATGTVSETAQLIKDQDLDILIFFDGYMNERLMEVVALRPAPTQVFWLGHAGCCEISAIDYVIADKVVIPAGEEKHYGAKIIRLPDTFHCTPQQHIKTGTTRRKMGLPDTGFVFCAFNNPEKIDRKIFVVWMRILDAVDGSVLWLTGNKSGELARNFRAEAEARGIAGNRLFFAERVADKAVHLARHEHCGLFLDTITLNASTTALDALWAGLPVLTVRGDRFSNRLSASYLAAIGLDDMICDSLENYEERAKTLATNAPKLGEIRQRLAANRETHPLFKIDVFCRHLENALEEACAFHCTA